MKVYEAMSTKIISVTSKTTLSEARKMLNTFHIKRMPVIDGGKLVGLVTRETLDRIGPSKLTTFSIHEASYLLNTITVGEVMHHDVVTCPPDTFVDDAVALAQNKKVGMMVVVDKGQVVGVATTNDFFYRLLNPILGIKIPGSRIYVKKCTTAENIQKVLAAVEKNKLPISSLFLLNIPEYGNTEDLVLHLNSNECKQCADDIKKLGFDVEVKAASK